jgi:membrane protein
MAVPTAREMLLVLKEAANKWSADNASRLSAALAYYTLLSLAPLLLVTVLIMGLVFGEDGARERAVAAMGAIVGSQGTAAIANLAESARRSDGGVLSSVIAALVALFGASGVFVELQSALNTIWNIPERKGPKVRSYAIGRFWSFVMVLGCAALLLLSVLSSAVLTIVGEFFSSVLPGGHVLWLVVNFALSLGLISTLFAAVFRSLPDTAIRWSDVWLGGLLTGVLFVLGNFLLGIYLGKSGVTSSFGGAGSIVAFVIWVYYSAQIIFLGAEFTHVFALRHGSKRESLSS